MGKKVYDSNSLDEEVGTIEDAATEEVETEEEEVEESEEEEETENEPEAKKKSKKEDKEGESEEESEEDESEEAEEEETKEEEESEEDADLDEAIKSRFGEDYEINSIEDLEQTLSTLDKIIEHNEELENELKELKATKPVFETPEQEKAYEFIKDMPKTHQGEGLQTWAELSRMDVDNTDLKLALRMQYIIKHNELTREEATRKFEKEYGRKYTVKPEDFDDDKQRQEEEEDRKIDLKSDGAKAKEFLKKQQQSYKAEPAKNEDPQDSEAVRDGIAENTRAMNTFLKTYKQLEFSYDGSKITYTLDEAKLKQVRDAASAYVANPASYSKKGKLDGFDPEENIKGLTFALFYKDIAPVLMQRAGTKTAVKRIEEIAGTKPNRKAKGGDATTLHKSEEEQWDTLIKEKEAKKKKKK